MDIYPVDYTSDVGRVRKYIPDLIQLPDPQDPTAEPSYMWSDDAIESFIHDEGGFLTELEQPFVTPSSLVVILRASASIMVATANNENLILKKLVTDDLQTDGPAVAKAMLASAQELRKRADELESKGDREETFTIVPYPMLESYPHYSPFWRGFNA